MSLLNAAINTVTIVATDDGADGTDAAATMTTGLTKAPAEMTVNLSGFGNNNTTTTNDVDILASVAAASDSAADIVHVVMGTATAASGATASASNTSDVELFRFRQTKIARKRS